MIPNLYTFEVKIYPFIYLEALKVHPIPVARLYIPLWWKLPPPLPSEWAVRFSKLLADLNTYFF